MANRIGTKKNPYLTAPDGWNEVGIPYGSYCKCERCGLIAPSTFMFDYYADNVGDLLLCESCKFGQSRLVAKANEEMILQERVGGR